MCSVTHDTFLRFTKSSWRARLSVYHLSEEILFPNRNGSLLLPRWWQIFSSAQLHMLSTFSVWMSKSLDWCPLNFQSGSPEHVCKCSEPPTQSFRMLSICPPQCESPARCGSLWLSSRLVHFCSALPPKSTARTMFNSKWYHQIHLYTCFCESVKLLRARHWSITAFGHALCLDHPQSLLVVCKINCYTFVCTEENYWYLTWSDDRPCSH